MSTRIAANPDLDARITADPSDLDNYLVYADWLQSQGDPRGDLITVQHALTSDPNNFDLIRAESRLIHSHPGHFLPEELLGLGNAEWVWRHGFLRVAALFGNQSALEQLLDHPSAKFLETLRCEEWLNADGLVECLSARGGGPTLLELGIDSGSPTVLPRSFWETCPRLERLSIGHIGQTLDELAHPGLRGLWLRSSYDAFDLEPLLDATATPALAELSVRGGSVAALESLIGSRLLPRLSRLTFRQCGLRDIHAVLILHNARAFEHLELLSFDGNAFERTERQLRDIGSHVDMGTQHFDFTLAE